MPTWTNDWNLTVDDGDRQVGFDVPDEQGVSGECLVTLDARVWREELNSPAGVRVTVTVEPLDADAAPEVADPDRVHSPDADPSAVQEAS